MKKVGLLLLLSCVHVLQASSRTYKVAQPGRACMLAQVALVRAIRSGSQNIASDITTYKAVFPKILTLKFQEESLLEIAEKANNPDAVHAILDNLIK